ncbi:MAG: hypothetical protein ACUVRY_02660 [Thermoanaerobaculaceae bacterium]
MSCSEVQERLAEGLRDAAVREHLAICRHCLAHARLLEALQQMEQIPEPPSFRLAARWPHPPWLFRLPFTYLPLALGIAAIALGFGLLLSGGGWPALRELRILPQALKEATGYWLWELGLQIVSGLARSFPEQLLWTGLAATVASLVLALWARKIRV